MHTAKIPDFVKDYPALLTRPYDDRKVVAWDIAFTQFGLPKEWTPRFEDERLGGLSGEIRVLTYSPQLLKSQSCRRVIYFGGKMPAIAPGTVTTIKKLIGFK